MVTEKSVDCLVEFDGTGLPTGNAWIDGVKFTGVTEATVGTLPRIDGKTTTKITLFLNATVDASTPPSSTADLTSFKVEHGKKGTKTTITKA